MDAFINRTKNQHFIAQVEQRFNAIENNVRKENMRIYQFNIVEKNLDTLELTSESGIKIEKNLAIHDLFTFDILENNDRYNFEGIYQQYENSLNDITNQLFTKINNKNENIGNEVIKLFSCKFLNFIRNPYSIEKIINTFHDLLNHIPISENFNIIYQKILTLNSDNQVKICEQLNINKDLYRKWLLINLLTIGVADESGNNILNLLVKSLFNTDNMIINIGLYTYTEQCCLLSDRGWIQLARCPNDFNFSFNIKKHCFATFNFTPKSTIELPNDFINQNLIIEKIKVCDFFIEENNFEILKKYNSNCISQSFKSVFCASRDFLLLDK